MRRWMSTAREPQFLPRRTGPAPKKPIPNVSKVIAVSSCKGGVGKSTIALNLAFSLAMTRSLRVGILDLDIFGPSLPTLLGLENKQPEATEKGALIPLTNHGMPSMSMGYLVGGDQPVVWRGLMVQKAVQQLLFDVDWSLPSGIPLDALIIDLPPGTGDVPLSLGQLVHVDGSLIISTPQRVALADVQKGISMLQKVHIPTTSIILNQSHVLLQCPKCGNAHRHPIFGDSSAFHSLAEQMSVPIGGELPLVQGVSQASDQGIPYILSSNSNDGKGRDEWITTLNTVASHLWDQVNSRK